MSLSFVAISNPDVAAKGDASDFEAVIRLNDIAVELATVSSADELVYTLHMRYRLLLDKVYCNWDWGDEVDELLDVDKTGFLVYSLCAMGDGEVGRQLFIDAFVLQEKQESFFQALSKYKFAKSLRSLRICSYSWSQNEDWSLLSFSPPAFPSLVDVCCQSFYEEQEEPGITFETCLSKTRLLLISSKKPALEITFEFCFDFAYLLTGSLEITAKDGLLSKDAIEWTKHQAISEEKTDVIKQDIIRKAKERVGWW